MTLRTGTLVVILMLAAACGGDTAGAEAFCNAARDASEVQPGNPDETLDVLHRMQDAAPDDIADAVETIVSSTEEAFETQDASIAQSEEFQEASAELDSYLEDNCEAPEDQ